MEAERDYEANPYDKHETRVVDYIDDLTDGTIGAGHDPVGFLIASHATLAQHIQELAGALKGEWDRVIGEVANFIEAEYPEHASTSAFAAAIRSMAEEVTDAQPSAEPEQQKP